jgi:hypothetical protein
MDSRHAIVNYKQTSNKQCHRPICLLGSIYLLTAAAVTVALTMIIGIGTGVGWGRGQNRSASVVQTTSQPELQNFTRASR